MTGDELHTMANTLVDDTIPETVFYQLLNAAKNKRERARNWQFLKKVDTSKTANSGDTYTSYKSLPSDFRLDLELFRGTTRYAPIPVERSVIYKDSPLKYYVDYANSRFALCGVGGQDETITLVYIYGTDDIASGTSPVWPADFHPILAYDVAAQYQAAMDADETSARMSAANRALAAELEKAMILWDFNLKTKGMDNSLRGVVPDDTMLDIGTL